MAEENKPKYTVKGCLKQLWFVGKLVLILLLMIGAGIIGAAIMNEVNNRNFSATRSELGKLKDRENELVSAVTNLEQENDKLYKEASQLREKYEAEQSKQKVEFVTNELGKRSMMMEISTPKFYVEFPKEFGNVSAKAFPASFNDKVKAAGIEIAFASSDIAITLEPWKFRGRALQKVEESKVTTADGQSVDLITLQEAEGKFLINAVLSDGTNNQDSIKLLITANAVTNNKDMKTDQIRDLIRSIEFNYKTLPN